MVPGKSFHYLSFSFSVDRGSVAEKCGIRVGDQIMEANGRSFENILHKDAVEFFKTYENVVLTVKVILSIMFKLLSMSQCFELSLVPSFSSGHPL